MGSVSLRRLTWILILGAALGSSDPLRPVSDLAPETFTPTVLDQQHLGGVLSDSLRANSEGYLEQVDPKREVQPYIQLGVHDPIPRLDESAGWFLRAAATAYEYNGDSHVKLLMDQVAARLVAAQKPDGYLGPSSDAHSWRPDELAAAVSNLNGLVAYSRITGDEAALAASRRMSDLITRTLYSDSIKHTLLGLPDWRSAPGVVGFIRPLVELYRSTDETRYLQFASGLASKFSGLQIDPESEIVYATGLTDLYRLNGDASLLKSATAHWKDVRDRHLSITGAPEINPPAAAAAFPRTPLASGCAVADWMQLNLELLRVTGEIGYADQIEQTLYNQLLASQDRRTGKIDSYVQLDGAKKFSFDLGPCHAAASYALAQIPNLVWGRYGEGIAIMSYSPGRAAIALRRRATVQIYTETDYPLSGDVVLHIEPSHDLKFPLRLRVPAWTTHFQAEVGRSRLSGKPGQFLIIEREWKKGSTVTLRFDLPVFTIRNEQHPGEVAVQRGTQILALDKMLNTNLQDLSSVGLPSQVTSLNSADSNNMVGVGSLNQVYSLVGKYSGQPRQLFLAPFADVSEYRVWLRGDGL